MRFDVLTLLPELFVTPLRGGVIGRAIAKGLLEVRTHNIRDFASDRHRTTDDSPYGGGTGMVMKAGPIARALESVLKDISDPGAETRPVVILMTPQGIPFNHERAKGLAAENGLVIICGRYEGVDERVRALVDIEISIGDYVLTGGEIPALVIIDAVGRLKPGVLGAEDGPDDDSFADGLLEYPQYTRPPDWRGLKVPEVLLSGNHREIERFRRLESIKRTFQRRPELLDTTELTDEERLFIEGLKADPQRGF
jgi:tRNA (guanine37-N1)-methyltransferase